MGVDFGHRFGPALGGMSWEVGITLDDARNPDEPWTPVSGPEQVAAALVHIGASSVADAAEARIKLELKGYAIIGGQKRRTVEAALLLLRESSRNVTKRTTDHSVPEAPPVRAREEARRATV